MGQRNLEELVGDLISFFPQILEQSGCFFVVDDYLYFPSHPTPQQPDRDFFRASDNFYPLTRMDRLKNLEALMWRNISLLSRSSPPPVRQTGQSPSPPINRAAIWFIRVGEYLIGKELISKEGDEIVEERKRSVFSEVFPQPMGAIGKNYFALKPSPPFDVRIGGEEYAMVYKGPLMLEKYHEFLLREGVRELRKALKKIDPEFQQEEIRYALEELRRRGIRMRPTSDGFAILYDIFYGSRRIELVVQVQVGPNYFLCSSINAKGLPRGFPYLYARGLCLGAHAPRGEIRGPEGIAHLIERAQAVIVDGLKWSEKRPRNLLDELI